MMAGGGPSFVMVADETDAAEEALPPGRYLAELRRSIWIILALVIAGALIGVGYTVVKPSEPTATAEVLLPSSSTSVTTSGESAPVPQTYILIAQSPSVLDVGAKNAHVDLSSEALLHHVSITSPTPTVLQINASDSSPAVAVALANGVASQFIRDVNQFAAAGKSAIGDLSNEETALENQISDLKSALAKDTYEATTKNPPSDVLGLIGQLQTQESNAGFELDSVESQIAQAKLSSNLATGAVSLATASRAVPPSAKRPLELAVIGALAGLLVGCVFALGRARFNRRLRTRDEIAVGTGAPVLTAISTKRPHGVSGWSFLLDRWRPTVGESARLSRLLSELAAVEVMNADGDPLEPRHPSANGNTPAVLRNVRGDLSLTAIVLAGDSDALAVGVKLGAYAAMMGMPTQLSVQAGGSRPSSLDLALERRNQAERRRVNLVTDGSNVASGSGSPSLQLSIMILDTDAPLRWDASAFESDDELGTSVLIVSSGFATAERIVDAAQIAAEEALYLAGVVVANPDRHDDTSGHMRTSPAPAARLSTNMSTS
jgi:capsular polysaccharide biosynthesis protein